jgi:hypothetical protein
MLGDKAGAAFSRKTVYGIRFMIVTSYCLELNAIYQNQVLLFCSRNRPLYFNWFERDAGS